jgi:tetratricopeptide (TPR) repeat protein
MNINYQTNLQPGELRRIELWYGQGNEGLWQLYDFDNDKISPVRFVAPGEGIYRFLVVAVDQKGTRSCQTGAVPETDRGFIPPDVAAQQVVFIDYTTPQLYLQSPSSQTWECYHRELKISWAGFDLHLGSRPLQLYYFQKNSPNETWMPITSSLPAIGDYLWQLPQELAGLIRIKLVLTDQAGNSDVKLTDWINIVKNQTQTTVKLNSSTTPPGSPELPHSPAKAEPQPTAITTPPDKPNSSQQQASDHLQRGDVYSQRLEWNKAIEAYQQALDCDEQSLKARLALADALYQTGQFEQSLQQFELCLQKQPNDPSTLYRLARTLVALEQYDKAKETFEKLLAQDSEDWQIWLLHGDMAQKLGQTDIAQKSWQKAAGGNLSFITRAAKERIGNY